MNPTNTKSSSSTRRREGRSAPALPPQPLSRAAAQFQSSVGNGGSSSHQQQHGAERSHHRGRRIAGFVWIWLRGFLTTTKTARINCSSYLHMVALLLLGLVSISLVLHIFIPFKPLSTVSSKFVSGRGIADMSLLGYQSKPRAMGYYFFRSGSQLKGTPQRLYTYYERYPSKRLVYMSERAVEAQKLLRKSRHYRRGLAEPFETRQCTAQYEWQLMSYPTCNTVHETDINDLHAKTVEDERARIIASGFWRDTWLVRDFSGDRSAFKTMRYEHGFEARNYDRHRRDALASERLTSSENVVDIYSFCGNSGAFEFAPGGDINDAIWPLENSTGALDNNTLTSLDKLNIAIQVSTAIADVHNIDKQGRPSIAHTDITPSQFIMINGKFKLSDLNRCRFIRWNRTDDKPCSYIVGRNPGKFRSPEEYNNAGQSEKVDVYSMGNIIYSLLTEFWPFEGMDEKEAQEKTIGGERPLVVEAILNSKDPIDIALLKAMEMCWRQDPMARASAVDVMRYLNEVLKEIQKKREM